MDIDEALRAVGGCYPWHLTLFILMGLSTYFALCWQGLSIVFVGWTPSHHCKLADGELVNETIPISPGGGYEACVMYANATIDNSTSPCVNGWNFHTNEYKTITSQWSLVCDDDWMIELSQTLFQIGALLGDLTCSILADRYGRRPVHMAGVALVCVMGSGVAFTQSYLQYAAVRMATAFAVGATVISGETMMIELFDTQHRSVTGIALEYMWTISHLSLALIGYLISDWRHLQLFISLVMTIWIIYIWILPESVFWLAVGGRTSEAEAMLNKLARLNRVKVEVKLDSFVCESMLEYESKTVTQRDVHLVEGHNKKHKTETNDMAQQESMIGKFPDLFRVETLRKHVIIGSLFWFTSSLVFYGLIFAIPSMVGDRHINFLISGLVDIPAYVLAICLVKNCGRCKSASGMNFAAGVAAILGLALPQYIGSDIYFGTFKTIMMILSKLFITVSFAIMVLYLPEVFPTTLRGSGVGICKLSGRVGNMLAPFVAYLARREGWIAGMLLGLVSIMCGIAVLFLPETLNKPLPQNIPDVYKLYKPKSKAGDSGL